MSVDYGGDYGWQPYESMGCQPTPECLTIELDGLTFTGRAPRGAGYGLTGWSGFIEAPDTKGGASPYESADGGHETPVYHQGRTITLEGVAVATSRQELWEMITSLGRILTSLRWGLMVATEDALGLSRGIKVRRTRAPKITFTSWTTAIFTIELESASFEKSGTVQREVKFTPGQSFAIENVGDWPARAYGELVGPLTNPVLSFPGGQWRYTGNVPTGERRLVNFTERNVTDPANARAFRTSASGEWPKIQPGTATYSLAGAGAGQFILRWFDAWS